MANSYQSDEKKLEFLAKRGYTSPLDFCYTPPQKVYDFSEVNMLSPDRDGKFSRIEGKLLKVEKATNQNNVPVTKIQILTNDLKPSKFNTLYITFYGEYRYRFYADLVGYKAIAVGMLSYVYGHYCMIEPPIFYANYGEIIDTWKVEIRKYKGIGADWLSDQIYKMMAQEELEDTLPRYVRDQFNINCRKESLYDLRHPAGGQDIMQGIRYCIVEDLMYFACAMEYKYMANKKDSPFTIKTHTWADNVIANLPFKLTKDQKQTIEDLLLTGKCGDRINALVQGDVGCGKSIVAYLLMLAMAENGYQVALMAPTLILAKQHYEDFLALTDGVEGVKVDFLSSALTAKESKQAKARIASGETNIIIGTHSMISESVEYKNLAMVLIDEEHRFGVKQREKLAGKASQGVHEVSFSATPIPRSIATSIYADKALYEIKSMPEGRKPIQTRIIEDNDDILPLIKARIAQGEQVYIICPLIDTDDVENTKKSVNDVAKYFESKLGKAAVGVVTGKQSKKATEETINAFIRKEKKILVATTVVEVGVNIPNATMIMIEDAYMFGLAQLHQLRGRVGRGIKQGTCILRTDRDTERLEVMCKTTDGFKIAEEDLRIRGAGNLIGEEQSGNNRFLELALSYPNLYKKAKVLAREMIKTGEDKYLMSEMERRGDKIYITPTKVRFFTTKT